MKAYILGAGGVGSWLAPSMAMLIGREKIIVVDGDVLEKKNLNRQLFNDGDIGDNKAEALGSMYGLESVERFYSFGCMSHEPEDWIICCADNHACRLAVLQSCDEYRCKCIIAANEKTSAEAYLYKRQWQGTPLDPRVYYPSILTDTSDDPTRPEGCTGEAQRATPQLVSANMMAASLAQWLFVFWHLKRPGLGRKVDDNMLSYRYRANMTMLETFKIGDTINDPRTNNDTGTV